MAKRDFWSRQMTMRRWWDVSSVYLMMKVKRPLLATQDERSFVINFQTTHS
ncbi:MAG: hypothetical protein IPK98_10940 [Chloracidobacterium sp.]|nr:hypothetical protein [Chloracidobacterium sp.]